MCRTSVQRTHSLQNVELAVHLLTPQAYIPIYIWEITARNMGWPNIFRHNFPCPKESKNTARCRDIFDLIFWDCGLHIEKGACNFGENTQGNKSLPSLKLKKYRIKRPRVSFGKQSQGNRLRKAQTPRYSHTCCTEPHTRVLLSNAALLLSPCLKSFAPFQPVPINQSAWNSQKVNLCSFTQYLQQLLCST